MLKCYKFVTKIITNKIAVQKSGTKISLVAVDAAKNRSAARVSVVKK